MSKQGSITYDDLPEEVVRVARSMVRGIFYNHEDGAPYDEELIAKNFACFVLTAAGWTPSKEGVG